MSSYPPRPAAAYGHEQMCALLTAGARVTGTLGAAAAAHALTFTALPGRKDFARHVEIAMAEVDGSPVTCAWVRDWDVLLADRDLYLTGGERRVLEVAASYAAGRPVNLKENGCGLGTAYARRLIETVITGAGMTGYYQLTGTAQLDELEARRRELTGEEGPR